MKVVFFFARRGNSISFEYCEVGCAAREVGGILIRNFRVPKIGFIGPGAQPEALLKCCPDLVGKGTIIEIDPSAWNLAAIFESARCGKDA